MPDQIQSPEPAPPAARFGGRNSWRPRTQIAWLRVRTVRRIGATAALVALVGLFGWLVFRPLFHPSSQLVFLSGMAYQPLQAPPASFAMEDFNALQGLAPMMARSGDQSGPLPLGQMRGAARMNGLGVALRDATPEGAGVLIVYIDGHGVSDDGAAYVLCRDFDPTNPSAGRYSLADLLKQVQMSPAEVKLLVLDSGRIPCDPRLGMLVNEFPRLLADAVRATGDPSLWAINSCSSFERSHDSEALGRSVFGFFFAQGLQGAADFDGSHAIDVEELYRYVAANTDAWVRRVSGGRESQTPLLVWGGGADLSHARFPVLMPVAAGGLEELKLPVKGAALPKVPADAASNPYASQAQNEFGPLAGQASRGATKKVPGAKAVKKTVKTTKKASRAVERVEGSPAVGERSGQKEPDAAKPQAAGGSTEAASQSLAVSPAPAKVAAVDQKPASAAELLVQAWRLRDKLEASSDQPRPLDYAPQTWREYQQWLLDIERLERSGDVANPATVQTTLQKLLPRLAQLPNVPPDDINPPDLAARIAAQAPRAPAAVDRPWSLAMAELLAQRGGAPLSKEEEAAGRALDRFTQDGSPAEFAAWIAKLDPDFDRFAELRLARELSRADGADWPTVQAALDAERLAQQVVTIDPALLSWIRQQVEQADRLRLAGEAKLIDGLGRDRQTQATVLLHQAIDQYQQAADAAAEIAAAEELRADLLNRAPYYVVLHRPVGPARAAADSRPDVLPKLFEQLELLAAALDAGDANRLPEIRDHVAQLGPLAERLEADFDRTRVQALTGRSAMPDQVLRIESLLATPLPDVDSRVRLLAALGGAERRLAAEYHEARIPDAIEPPAATAEQWRQVVDRAQAELALAHLAAGNGATAAKLLKPLDAANAALLAAHGATGAPTAKRDDSLWSAARQMGVAVRDFYAALPGRVENIVAEQADLSDPATRPDHLQRLRHAVRMLRLMDARDVKSIAGADPAGVLAAADWYDLLVWQQRRLEGSQSDAAAADVAYLAEAIESLHGQAERIAHEPPPPAIVAAPLELSGPSRVDMTTESERTVQIAIHSTAAGGKYGSPTAPARIALDSDPDLLTVSPLTPDDRALLSADHTLRPGGSETLQLRIHAKPTGRGMTKLIVKVASGDAAVRHEVEIMLPPPEAIEIAVDGSPGTWTPTPTRLLLDPFPNRRTQYRLNLLNAGLTDRRVDVELLSVEHAPLAPPPPTSMAPEDAAAMIARFGATTSLVALPNIAVRAGGGPAPIPFPKPDPAAQKTPAAPPTPLDHGLLIVVTDRQTNWKSVRWLDVAVQRPRRYIHPRVGYNLDRGQIEIHVRAQDKSLLPADGVHLRAELVPPLPPGAQAELNGVLRPADEEIRLSADVAAEGGKIVTVRLSADGYPRAFVYRVPCWAQTSDVPEDTDLREVRILSPQADAAFKAPIESIPVDCQVDAPLGAFSAANPDDLFEIGIDVHRERELRGGPSLRLRADRQVRVGLDRLAPGGLLSLDTQVGDFHLAVPAPALTAARVDVLGRITAGGKTGWSQPVEIVLDGAPPRIERIELHPSTVTAGPDEELSVWATDEQLSGVAKVEAAFDPAGGGQFGPTAKPVLLERDSTGRWFGKIPTKDLPTGEVTLLVRATDRVENASDYAKFKISVTTAGEAAAKTAGTARVSGTVWFGSGPAPNALVTLDDGSAPAAGAHGAAAASKFPPVTTNDQGAFTFAAVPPGKYKLTATALIHNKNRKIEQDITIAPGETNPKPVKLVLK